MIKDMCMIEMDKESLMSEVRGLCESIENAKSDLDIYCQLMVQLFLKESTNN